MIQVLEIGIALIGLFILHRFAFQRARVAYRLVGIMSGLFCLAAMVTEFPQSADFKVLHDYFFSLFAVTLVCEAILAYRLLKFLNYTEVPANFINARESAKARFARR